MNRKRKIILCVIMIGVVLSLTSVMVDFFKFLNLYNENEATQHINYDTGIEMIQSNQVKEVIVYPFSVEICCYDNSFWNYTFEFPDREIFLEFIQEEIENGNKFHLKKAEILSITGVYILLVCIGIGIYIVEMYLCYKIFRGIIAHKEIEIPEEEKKIRAYHEAGHVLAIEILKIQCNITAVSILSDDNGNIGYIYYNADENRDYTKKTEFKDQLVVLLAGRAAEKEALGENSSMCFDDLIKAANIAKKMVAIYGMDDEIGPISFWNENSEDVNLVNSDICNNVENQIQKLLKEAENKVAEIIKTERYFLDKIAQALLEKEVISGEELEEIIKEEM